MGFARTGFLKTICCFLLVLLLAGLAGCGGSPGTPGPDPDPEAGADPGGAPRSPGLAVGETAPEPGIADLAGEPVRIADHPGRIVLLHFFTTWCQYCSEGLEDLEQLDRENEDLVVIAVNVGETYDTVADYLSFHGSGLRAARDPDGRVAGIFRVGGYPTTAFIDAEGFFLGNWPGVLSYEQGQALLDAIRDAGRDPGEGQ